MKGGKHLNWAKEASALAHFSRQWLFPQRLFTWSCSLSQGIGRAFIKKSRDEREGLEKRGAKSKWEKNPL